MSEVLLSLKSYFKTSYVIIDNDICRLHYKITVAILLAFSILVTTKQYFGDPIDCIVPKDSIDSKMLDTYCWIHKTFSVEKAFKMKLDTEVAYPGVAPHKTDDKLVHHSYYQWVCFVLFLQGCAFYVPRFIWKLLEGNRVRHLSCDLSNPLLEQDKRDKQISLIVTYMKDNKDCHVWYLVAMVCIEVSYLLNVIIQIYVMDVFLGGEFSRYGWDVLRFTEQRWETRYDPMIRVFPRMAKCTFRMYGTSGDIQRLDAACILPINILNEKIYVFLWFWFLALAVVTSLWLVYRAMTIMLQPLRVWLLKKKTPKLPPTVVNDFVYSIDTGDWLITYLIAQNIDSHHLAALLKNLHDAFRRSLKSSTNKENDEGNRSGDDQHKNSADSKKETLISVST